MKAVGQDRELMRTKFGNVRSAVNSVFSIWQMKNLIGDLFVSRFGTSSLGWRDSFGVHSTKPRGHFPPRYCSLVWIFSSKTIYQCVAMVRTADTSGAATERIVLELVRERCMIDSPYLYHVRMVWRRSSLNLNTWSLRSGALAMERQCTDTLPVMHHP